MIVAVVAAGDLARTGEAAKSGPIGLAVILLLIVACYFLFKSMSKHLKTVREEFPQPEAEALKATDADVGVGDGDNDGAARTADPALPESPSTGPSTGPSTDPPATH